MRPELSRHTARPTGCGTYGKTAAERGLQVIIAGAGGAAHLPGMMASKTRLPVIGVPVQTQGAFRRGQPVFDRADAARLSRCHDGDRRQWGRQCRIDGRRHSGLAG